MDPKQLSQKEAAKQVEAADKNIAAIKKRITGTQGQYSSPEISKIMDVQVTALALDLKAAEKEKQAASIRKEAAKAGFLTKEQEESLHFISYEIKKLKKEKDNLKSEKDNVLVSAKEIEEALKDNRRLVELQQQHQAELNDELRKDSGDRDSQKIVNLEKALEETRRGIKTSEGKFREFERRQSGGVTGVVSQGAVNAKSIGKDLLGQIAPGLAFAIEGITELRDYNKKQRQEGKEEVSVVSLLKNKVDEITGGMASAITGINKGTTVEIPEIVEQKPKATPEPKKTEKSNKPKVEQSTSKPVEIPNDIAIAIDAATTTAIKDLELAAKMGKITQEELSEIKIGIHQVVSNTDEIEKAIKELDKPKPQVKRPSATRQKQPTPKQSQPRDSKGRFVKAPQTPAQPQQLAKLATTEESNNSGSSVLSKAGKVLSSTTARVAGGIAAAGAVGYGIGNLINEYTPVQSGIASALDWMTGPSDEELAAKNAEQERLAKLFRERNAQKQVKQAVLSDKIQSTQESLDEKAKAKQTTNQQPPQVTVSVPPAPAPIINQIPPLTVRNQDNSFVRITDKMMLGAFI